MKKLVISVATIALISSVSFADGNTNADANQTNSGVNFKGLASKTYNFLGIQTKEDNQKAFETIIADTNAIKIQLQEYVKQTSLALSLKQNSADSKLQDEKIAELKKEVVDLKDEIKFLKNLLNETLKSSKIQQN